MTKRKRQKLTKAQAREQARRKRQQQRITWAVVGVVVVAVAAVLILITLSGGGGESVLDVPPLRDDLETGVTDEGYPYRGPADAPVTILEFSDYNCPVCGDFVLGTTPLIDDQLIATGQVKYVVQPFALWEGSLPIVEAAACARDQDGFWYFHHLLFANQSRFSTRQPPSRGMLRELAEAVGLDVDEFQACLDQGLHKEEVLASTRSGKDDLGVTSTPTFFVNGVKTQLYRDEAYIDTLRKAVQAAQASESSE